VVVSSNIEGQKASRTRIVGRVDRWGESVDGKKLYVRMCVDDRKEYKGVKEIKKKKRKMYVLKDKDYLFIGG